MAKPLTDAAESLAGTLAWIVTDGNAGNEQPCLAVAEALGAEPQCLRVAPRPPWTWLAPWGPADPNAQIGKEGSSFRAPWPALVLGSGRQSVPFLRALRVASGGAAFTVFLQNPRTRLAEIDLICAPAHDAISGPNVFTTVTSPHPFSPGRLAKLRQDPPAPIAALPRPRVAIILGGPSGAYRYGKETLERFDATLRSLAALGVGLMVTPSRRTPAALIEIAQEATASAPRVFWDGEGHNPYPQFLALADALVVTADSFNMVSEACATGRPVYVLEPEGGSTRFQRFHERLRYAGVTRPAPAAFREIEYWEYEPVDATPEVAAEIERRWLARKAG